MCLGLSPPDGRRRRPGRTGDTLRVPDCNDPSPPCDVRRRATTPDAGLVARPGGAGDAGAGTDDSRSDPRIAAPPHEEAGDDEGDALDPVNAPSSYRCQDG